MRNWRPLFRVLLTLVVVLVAAWAARLLWVRNQLEPWTRDGRVRADVVRVAPDISGLVTDVMVRDNQLVRRGQVLFIVDRPRYRLALAQAEAAVATQRAALLEAEREDRRNRRLKDILPQETVEQGSARVDQLRAALGQAVANRDLAVLNLERTTVAASVDGIATNVDLEPGDFLPAGKEALALIATGSMHVDGYFEETKLPAVRVGDPARIQLMGVAAPLMGHVESISGGIEDRERGPSGDLLANVNPTFSWVRLPQRIPVRIAIDQVPEGVRLVTGRTATVTILPQRVEPVVARSFPW